MTAPNICPCIDCVPPKRRTGCHSSCPEYEAWNNERLAKKAEVSKAKSAEQDFMAYVVKEKIKNNRKKNVQINKRK